MEIERYFEQIVDPTIAGFEANPTSVRHAFLAAVTVSSGLRGILTTRRVSPCLPTA